jgi:PAS domain S-box-containing protein
MGKKCLLMSGRDITIQKKLLEEYQQFEAVFNQSRDPMVITTLNEDGSIGGYLKVNNAYVEIMGYTRDELAELTPLDIAKSESVEKIHVIANILKQGGFVEGLEWFTQTKDGTELCLSLNIQLIPLMGQQCVLVVGRDISLQKELISELKEAETQRMKFESMVAHELRTPLQAILGFTEVLDSHTDQLDENTLYMIISTIKKNIFRLENIVNTITDVSDIEHNIYGLNLEVHDFRNFMHEIQETYKHLGIRFFPWASDKPIFLNIDDKKLRMVFEHLIDNAIRNTNKNNRVVTVTPTLFKHSIQITISDNGAGIAQENLEKIFDKFVSIPTKYAVDGTGVGLYLARQILLAHSGTITANSEGVGHGATFTIHLPREDFLRRGLPIKSILADDFKLSKIHILMLHEISEIITEYLPIEHEVINFLLLKSAFRWLITKGQQETTDPLLTKSRIKEDFNNFMLMVEQTIDTIFPEPRWFKYVRVTMKAIKTHFQNSLKDIGSRQDLIESHSDKELFKYY